MIFAKKGKWLTSSGTSKKESDPLILGQTEYKISDTLISVDITKYLFIDIESETNIHESTN